ncbi:MAG TPA: sigma-70 family RNA polymerase sigma factor [Acidimicrobiales bacterium]|nr:sigma-70 family RNA polymerase sigma factor [Acidimicrobiales bacterium]
MSSPLLREWDLLQQQVIPLLLDAESQERHPRMWAVGSVADAVAVAAAYQHARHRESNDLRAFASEPGGPPGPVAFSLADVRCVPVPTRAETFERHARRWVPGTEVAGQVILGRPDGAVDLVTIRPEASDREADRAIDHLGDGGHVLLVDEAPDLDRYHGLRPVAGSGRMFRKCTRGRITAAPAEPDTDRETLAHRQAQADLVASHAQLARSLARRFFHHGESRDDLEQVALLALVKAARRFDPGREISFSTYATASILGELKRHFRDKTWTMRVPRSIQESYLAVKQAREALTHELSCSPTIQQISGRLGISDETVLEAMEAGENYWAESLDAGTFDGDAGRDVPVLESGFELTLERQQFAALLPRLAPRERLILKRIYFDGWTQRRVAEEVGVSQMQISRLLSKAMEKLRGWVREDR